MSDDPTPPLGGAGESPLAGHDHREPGPASEPRVHDGPEHQGKKKHQQKVRSAWISFIGRIVAQFVGAAATIVLGLVVLNQYSSSRQRQDPVPANAAARAPAIVPRVDRSQGAIAVAVLPFENFSGDAAQDFLADGLTELVISELARLNGLHVISRTSSMSYKGLRKTVPQVASELGVDLIVEGSVARHGGRVRVVAQLIDALSDCELWSHKYDRPDADVLTLQAEVAASIAGEIAAAILTPVTHAAVRGGPAVPQSR